MKIKRYLRILVSASLIGYLVYLVDFSATLERIGQINVALVWIAAPLLLAQAAISAFKWGLVLQLSRIRLSFIFLWKTYLKGNFISLFLPTSFGGDVYRVVRLKQESGRLGDSASSVLFDRISGLFALVTIALVGYVCLPDFGFKLLFFVLYAAGIVAYFFVTSELLILRLERVAPAAIKKWLHPLRAFKEYRKAPAVFLAIIAIAFVFQFNIVVINKIYCAALGIDIPFMLLLAIIPIIYLTEVLPISINGIGVRDSAFVFFFSYLGYSQEEGLAVALLVLFFRYLVGSVGGLIFLSESIGPREPDRPSRKVG